MNIHGDERRLGLFDIFGQATPGQVNLIRLYPGQFCGWHRHQRQIDHYFCVSGVVKVGTTTPDGLFRWQVLDAHHPEVLTVPELWWHGYGAIGGEAILLQYLDQKYDPLRPDEEKREFPVATG